MARFVFLVSILLLLQLAFAMIRCPTARYKVTIIGKFTRKTVPGAPGGTHFSPLTVFSHSPSFCAVALSKFASEGIKVVAEIGNNAVLLKELASESAVVKDVATTGLFAGDEVVSAFVNVNCSMPVITGVTMVAPSPDWFVAISNINMFSGKFFMNKKEGDLNVYDAGTDSGTTFLAKDVPTNPRERITRLGAPFNVPAASYKIEKVRRSCPRTRYLLTVINEWTTARFRFAPKGNLLSPLTAFSHRRRFSAFKLSEMASAGVKKIAEEGDNTIFLKELRSNRAPRFINDISTSFNRHAAMGKRFSVKIEVDCRTRYISFISMLFPSPDWIIAKTSINTMINGKFKGRISGRLFAYDAGTDSGKTARAKNFPTKPAEKIAKIQRAPFGGKHVARFSLRKMAASKASR